MCTDQGSTSLIKIQCEITIHDPIFFSWISRRAASHYIKEENSRTLSTTHNHDPIKCHNTTIYLLVESLIRGSDSTITTSSISSMDKHCGTFSPKAVGKPYGMAGIIQTIEFHLEQTILLLEFTLSSYNSKNFLNET